MTPFRKLIAASALLLASAQSHAFPCPAGFYDPTFSATQTVGTGQTYSLNITVSGVDAVCNVSGLTASMSSFEIPYFSDTNAIILTPNGWSYSIQNASGSELNLATGFSTIRFFATNPSFAAKSSDRLSGFVFNSQYAAVSSPFEASFLMGEEGGTFDTTAVSVDRDRHPLYYLFIPGSPLALQSLGNPDPAILPAAAVPEPSTAAMLGAGMVMTLMVWRRRQRITAQTLA